MWELVLRPPRHFYDEGSLPPHIPVAVPGGVMHVPRLGFRIKNSRGQTIVGSFYKPTPVAAGHPAILYLHGNASSQCEGMFVVQMVAVAGVSTICIDCAGSGLSDGYAIGLGVTERDDVAATVRYAREAWGVGGMMLWGRSMGAATALWCVAEDLPVQGVISDSGYESGIAVAEDIFRGKWWMTLALRALAPFLSFSLRRNAGFGVKDIAIPMERLARPGRPPLLMVHGTHDTIVGVRQAPRIFRVYGSEDKFLLIHVGGEHNSQRSGAIMDATAAFIMDTLHLSKGLRGDVRDGGARHAGTWSALATGRVG